MRAGPNLESPRNRFRKIKASRKLKLKRKIKQPNSLKIKLKKDLERKKIFTKSRRPSQAKVSKHHLTYNNIIRICLTEAETYSTEFLRPKADRLDRRLIDEMMKKFDDHES